jgi:hypothetical protein
MPDALGKCTSFSTIKISSEGSSGSKINSSLGAPFQETKESNRGFLSLAN